MSNALRGKKGKRTKGKRGSEKREERVECGIFFFFGFTFFVRNFSRSQALQKKAAAN